jgi:hypothetical protein
MGVAKKKKNDVVLRIAPHYQIPCLFEQRMQCRIMSSRCALTVQYIIHVPEMLMMMMMLGILRKNTFLLQQQQQAIVRVVDDATKGSGD